MANLIFVGPPGAGKATQATRLVKSRNVLQVCYGTLIRNALGAETQLGSNAREAVDAGHVIPDDVIIGLVEERLTLEADDRGYVLVGIPKWITQADGLQEMLSRIGKPMDLAVFFDLRVDVMISRLLTVTPAITGTQLQKLKIGYEHFMLAAGPLFSFYDARGRSLRIDASLSPDDVAAQIEAGLIGKSQPRLN